MVSEQEIADQLELLTAHRATLMAYRQSRAKTAAATPPHVISGIKETRAQIRRIKEVLRGWGVEVEDMPGDKALANITFDHKRLIQTYGTDKPVSITTEPTGLGYKITYTGIHDTNYDPSDKAPSNVGMYKVSVIIDSPNYEGTTNETLT